jgi:hypothetical protein
MKVYTVNENINDTISLATPSRLQGGNSYYSKIVINDNNGLFLQLPKCTTKNGIVQTNKLSYADFMFSNNNQDLVNWVETFETKMKQLLLQKSSLWFQNEMDYDDIDYFFNPIIKQYKGKFYLFRGYVNTNTKGNIKQNDVLQIYDDNEVEKSKEDIENKNIIPMIHLKGVRFTSSSFHIDVDIKQIMILEEKDTQEIFSKCLIKKDILNNDEYEKNSQSIFYDIDDENKKDEEEQEQQEQEQEEQEEQEQYQVQEQQEQEQEQEQQEQQDENTKEEQHLQDENSQKEVQKELNNDTMLLNGVNKTLGNTQVNSLNKDTLIQEISEIQDKKKQTEIEELEELEIDNLEKNDDSESIIQLKSPNEVYYEIYKEALNRAKLAKKAAVLAYLEAKNIKNTYMLDDIDDSDNDENSSCDNISLDELSELSDYED